MKKKIVSYLILACSLIGMVTIGSCRDYDDYADLRAVNKIDHQRFDDSLDSLRHDVDSIFELLKNMCTCTVNCDSLDSVVHNLDSAVTKWLLKGMTADSIKDVLGLDSTFQDSNDVAGVLRYLNKRVNDVRHDLDSIADTLTNTDKILMRFDTIIKNRVDTLDSIVMQVLLPLRSYKDTIDSITPILRDLRKAVYDTIMPKMKALEQRMDTLEHRVDSLMDAEKKRITSLYVEGTANPIFGTFALPLGVRSSILSTYYGTAEYATQFPIDAAYASGDDAALVDKSAGIPLTATELANTGFTSFLTINANEDLVSDSADNAGKIYFTVNPIEVDAADTTIYRYNIVNSLGQIVVDSTMITDIKLTTDTLKFGLNLGTRAGGSATDGVYEAKVKITNPDNYKPSVKMSVEEMKDVVSNTFANGSINLSGLSGAIFQLAQTQMDATSLRVSWKDSLGEHSVSSRHDVAVAAVTPLSYSFGNGYKPWVKVANKVDDLVSGISPITDLTSILGTEPSINLDLSGITVIIDTNIIKIDFKDIVLNATTGVQVVVDMPTQINDPDPSDPDPAHQTHYWFSTKKDTISVDSLDVMLTRVQNSFNGSIVQWEDTINKKLRYVADQIKASVEDMISTVGGQLSPVNTMFHDMYSNFGNNNYVKKLNSLITRMQSLSTRLTNKLDRDFSVFLKPLIVYEGKDKSLHPMSNVKSVPSIFTGGTGEITLYATSYTAELLAPAYKKYIAVVEGPTPSAISNANSGDMNAVIDGNKFTIKFKANAIGLYTIYYSAIDYKGHITAQRFYVKVTD